MFLARVETSSQYRLVCVLTLQTGLIVACYQGYVDVVIALSQCPHLDVNWQDNEGNTALTTAAQAGKNNLTALIQSCTYLHLYCHHKV